MSTPYFLWDYDINEKKVREILEGKNEKERIWLTSRILSHAKFDDVFKYLSVSQIARDFAKLQLPENIKKAWQRALIAWGIDV